MSGDGDGGLIHALLPFGPTPVGPIPLDICPLYGVTGTYGGLAKTEEIRMLKGVIGLVSLAFVASSSLAYAQQASGPSQADLNALTDARIAIVKASLQLTPDQAKYWPAVEEAMRARVQTRNARIAAVTERLNQQREVDPIELLRGRANALAQRAAGLNKLVDAWEPLYRRCPTRNSGCASW